MTLLLLLALVLAPGVRAQGSDSEGSDSTKQEQQVPRSEDSVAPAAGGDAQGHMSLEDARINFPTVVQAFVDKRSDADGLWPLRDKETGKLRKLKLVSLASEKAKEDGDGLFSAPGVVADMANNGEKLPVVFTCNFAGSEWRVEKLRFVKPKAAKRPQPKKS